jgi:hypothetical protein
MSETKKESKFPAEYGTLGEVVYADKAWGGIWHGEHASFGKVLFVIYSTGDGREMLKEALPVLERWKLLAHGSAPGLLNVLDVKADARVPHVVVKGTDGSTLHTRIHHGQMEVKDRMRAIAAVAKTLSLSKTYEIPFVGIAPWSIIAVQDHDAPWQLIPVAPGAVKHAKLLNHGKYIPPSIGQGDINELNPDVFSLSLIGIEAVVGDFHGEESPVAKRDAVPYERLRMILTNGLKQNKGAYDDPKMLQLALERWIKAEADEDIKEHQAKVAASQRTPFQQRVFENRRLLIGGGGAVLGLIFCVFVVICIMNAFSSENTEHTPYGMLNLYFEAIEDGDAAEAKKYATGAAAIVTDNLLAEIRSLEERNLASKFAEAVPRVAGDTGTRTAKIDLKGENGDLFMEAEATIRVEPTGEWRITDLYFKPLRGEQETDQQ